MSWDKVDEAKRKIEEKAEEHRDNLIYKELGRMQYEDPRIRHVYAAKVLYFIIFCLFLLICFLAIIDAPSPLTTYPSGSGSMIIPFSFMI